MSGGRVATRRFALSRAVVPQMKQRRSGKLLFVTSAAPLRGLPNYSMYATARRAANALAVSLARELAPFQIQVNAIDPNFVESPTHFPAKLFADPEALKKKSPATSPSAGWPSPRRSRR
jgi:NAD(P)-dependent dehydrogenase (short-subunit alcohol dehydrogenase family)